MIPERVYKKSTPRTVVMDKSKSEVRRTIKCLRLFTCNVSCKFNMENAGESSVNRILVIGTDRKCSTTKSSN